MSFVNVDPFGMLAAAATLESLGSHMAVSNAAVASVTTKVPPPAADYVSKKLSLFFSSHGQQYQVQGRSGHGLSSKIGPDPGEWRACV